MNDDDDVTDEFRTQLHDAVERSAARETDVAVLHARLGDAVAARLDARRRRASDGSRGKAATGVAWWDYAARGALAGVPLGLAAALLLLTFLRSGGARATDAAPAAPPIAVAMRGADSARAAFDSVLTGDAAPGAVMATLIPVPAAAFLADLAAGRPR